MNQQAACLHFLNEFNLDASDIKERLNQPGGWETKFRTLMLLGKSLPPLPAELQQVEFQVQGCESKVWLMHHWQDGKLILACSSDAKIIKGLISVLLAAFNNKTAIEIDSFDFEAYLTELNLLGQLSPSRTNGLHAIVKRIRELASNPL